MAELKENEPAKDSYAAVQAEFKKNNIISRFGEN